jgi:hypothetical protein
VEEHLHTKGEALYRKQRKNLLDSPSVIRWWRFQGKGLCALCWNLKEGAPNFT